MFLWGFRGFVRNGWLSTATVAMVALALTLTLSLLLFSLASSRLISLAEGRVDLSIYIQKGVPESDALTLRTLLAALPEVESAVYQSPEERLAAFRERHASGPTTLAALSELDENPLLASITVRAKDPSQYTIITRYLEAPRFGGIIDHVNLQENVKVVERITRLARAGRELGMALAILLGLLAVVVAFSSIRLAIYSLREEVAIMRLVGASNWFIRGPFIVQGIIFGTLGTLFAFLVVVPAVFLAEPQVQRYLPDISLVSILRSNIWVLVFTTLILGIVVGVGSSMIAIRRYLKI